MEVIKRETAVEVAADAKRRWAVAGRRLQFYALAGPGARAVGCRQERVYLPVPGRYDGAYPYAEVRRVFSS